MDLGCFTAHEQYPPGRLLEHVAAAEAAGFDAVWTSDHFHPWWHTGAECGAAWPWLGSALERTDDVRIGTGVTATVGRYHPGLVAQTFATLGAMYPGRVHCTLATGEALNEKPLGYDWPPYAERRRRLIDACEIVRSLWNGEVCDYEGHHWETDDAKLYTLPDEPVPLYVAGNGPETARVAGRYADGFLTLADVETYRTELVPALEEGAAEADRNPEEIDRIRQFSVSYAENYDDALDAVEFWTGSMAVDFDDDVYHPPRIEQLAETVPREKWTEWGLVTTEIEDVRAAIDRHREAGFDEIEFLSTSPDQERFIEAVGSLTAMTS
ncbi:TIGR03557 family F420-dependent LLM class oxidoreductase [Halopenitus persicus]|uniref:F420-dependent oxidoreductase, G6PDH family n=1 Tax=Halopenitus persicus TaxID=1048396 RepID=A0A1H3FMT0_9EURY|nr:TIGR03557 family F420-dependent LLM class oxidoreductase [Halopenitus persicus]SDX91454.1 F420-dependent oxidoreductase, G6PDH family [Halopenitus persicus]